MATSKIKGLDEPTLEGGGGGGGMGRGSSTQIKGHRSDPIIEKLKDQLGVDRRAGRIKSEVIDLSKGSKSMLEEAERNKALDQFRRKQALSEAITEGGVTKYPYIEPTSKKTGGAVTASRRADGIAMRGKTRGKMC
jgi:hypothetical protein